MWTIQTSNLTKVYNQGQPNEVASVKGVDLQLSAGSCTLLKGPSGSGKTTLLMLLGCLARPTEGSYHCLGQQVSRWSEKHLTRFRKQHIGIVFQRFHLIQGLSVAENIALPLLPQGLSGKALKHAAAQAAEQVHIGHRLDFAVDRLSGGEMQRVAIARALVSSPDILLADEPTSQLDTDNSLSVLSIFQELVAQGKTLVLTTHDPLVEQHLPVQRIVQMKDGRVVGH